MPCFTQHVLLACILLQIHPLLLAVQHNSLLVPCCPVVRLCCAPFWLLTPSKTTRTKNNTCLLVMAPPNDLLYKCKVISRIHQTMAKMQWPAIWIFSSCCIMFKFTDGKRSIYRRSINKLAQQPRETVLRDILIEQYYHSGLTFENEIYSWRLVTKVLKL